MEGSICVWASGGVKCDTLLGHQATISKIKVDDSYTLVSSSYDCTLRVWPLKFAKFKHKNCGEILIGAHKSPVMTFDWANSLVASGDKTGNLVLWDINSAKPVFKSQCHKGGINCIKLLDPNNSPLIATGGLKDGIVNIFDLRTHQPVSSLKCHAGCITSLQSVWDGNLISTGTDSLIKIFDK